MTERKRKFQFLRQLEARPEAARRGELDAEEEAEVHTFWAAFERRAAEARGEGGLLG